MNRRKEPCRNFQRGSCQYGDRCKFLHVTQQQSKPNPFGFGTQATSQFPNLTQQQKPNPFGFGVQTGSQLKGASTFGTRSQGPTKPFENKWVRPTSSTPSQQNDTQPQAAIHKCTDPESCKHHIVEDFKNEAPLWRLTCYGHCKNGPCDIVGDVSYEELRATAYDDARQGLPLQSIIERERNLLNSKLIEFDNFLRNPYAIRKDASSAQTSAFPGTNNSAQLLGAHSDTPPLFSSFSQLGTSAYLGSTTRTYAQGSMPDSVFRQPSTPQSSSQTSGGFKMEFGMSGVFDTQTLAQPSQISPSPNTSDFLLQHLFPSSLNSQMLSDLDGPNVTLVTAHPLGAKQEVSSADKSIWLKEAWAAGEIPEDEPPEMFR